MGTIKDGGPAFPIKGYCADASGALCGEVITYTGMTLRDFFAAAALTGIHGWFGNTPILHDVAAKIAFDVADAMLAEREKK